MVGLVESHFEGFEDHDSDCSDKSCGDDDFDPRFVEMVIIHSISDGGTEQEESTGVDGKIDFYNSVDSTEYYRYLDEYHQLLLK